MLELLNNLDIKIFLWLNGLHSPLGDTLMPYFSTMVVWLPLYLFTVYLIFRKFHWKGLWVILFTVMCVALTDMVSFHAFKEVFHRLRPGYDPSIVHLVHIAGKKGNGRYGFVSSHAANVFWGSDVHRLSIERKMVYYNNFSLGFFGFLQPDIPGRSFPRGYCWRSFSGYAYWVDRLPVPKNTY